MFKSRFLFEKKKSSLQFNILLFFKREKQSKGSFMHSYESIVPSILFLMSLASTLNNERSQSEKANLSIL